MLQYELILELREFLSEHVYTCFFTNYYLEHAGVKLSDYSDLSEMDLDSDPYIHMRPQLYTENSARTHIKRVNEILTTPCLQACICIAWGLCRLGPMRPWPCTWPWGHLGLILR